MVKQFLRADTFRHFRLGKNRKKLQRWRKPRGKHNKLRLKRVGHPVQPGVGFGRAKTDYGKIKGVTPMLVHNAAELELVTKGQGVLFAGNIGAKKKLVLIKRAEELKLPILNGGRKK